MNTIASCASAIAIFFGFSAVTVPSSKAAFDGKYCSCTWEGSILTNCAPGVDFAIVADDTAASSGVCVPVTCGVNTQCKGTVVVTVTALAGGKMWDQALNNGAGGWAAILSASWKGKSTGGPTECGSPFRYAKFDIFNANGAPRCDLQVGATCWPCMEWL